VKKASLYSREVFRGFFIKNIYTLFFILLIGCSSSTVSNKQTSSSFVSLSPGTTEILFALGLEKRIAAVTDFCNYPPQALKKASVGSFSFPSLERIISFNPEIIFAAGGPQERILVSLENIGYRVERINPSSVDELFEAIIKIGKLTGKEKESRKLVADMSKKIDEIRNKTDNRKHPSVFIEISERPLMTAGGKSFINEMVQIAGGKNVAENIRKDYFNVNYEFIIEKNPDIILIFSNDSSGKRKDIIRRKLSDATSASVNNKVFSFQNKDIFLRPGPRIVDGIEKISELLYGKEL